MSFLTGMNFKTQLCKFWMRDGKCKYMSRCRFAHGTSELKYSAPITTTPNKQLRMILTTSSRATRQTHTRSWTYCLRPKRSTSRSSRQLSPPASKPFCQMWLKLFRTYLLTTILKLRKSRLSPVKVTLNPLILRSFHGGLPAWKV